AATHDQSKGVEFRENTSIRSEGCSGPVAGTTATGIPRAVTLAAGRTSGVDRDVRCSVRSWRSERDSRRFHRSAPDGGEHPGKLLAYPALPAVAALEPFRVKIGGGQAVPQP